MPAASTGSFGTVMCPPKYNLRRTTKPIIEALPMPIDNRRTTRSMGKPMLFPVDWKEKGKKSRTPRKKQWNKFYAESNEPMLANMLDPEKQETELILAFTAKKEITIPSVELLTDDEYNKMYPNVFSEMPTQLVKDSDRNVKPKAKLKKESPVIVAKVNLPVVRIQKIDFSEILGEKNATCGRFKILKDIRRYVKLVHNVPKSNGKIFTIPKLRKISGKGALKVSNR